MHKILGIVAALAVAMLVGCQQQAKSDASQSALDVRPVHKLTPTYSLAPEMVTPPDEPKPALSDGPLVSVTPGFNQASSGTHSGKAGKSAAAAQGNSYKVKKGDTLYHIAKSEYGDGKKWTLIASANPGVSPQSLRAGQTLLIP